MNLFNYLNYKEYLQDWIRDRPAKGRGEVSKLARTAKCHITYFSQILNGKAELSLEQADQLCPYLGLGEKESNYFLLLVQFSRAGTHSLRTKFQKKIEGEQTQHLNLKNRIQIKEQLSELDKMKYYSSWIYGAIHIMTAIPTKRSAEIIAESLHLSLSTVREALDFLVRAGLVSLKGNQYVFEKGGMHLGADSPLIAQHHTNWRMRAIQSLETKEEQDFHYSSVISMAQKDIQTLKKIFVEAVESARAIIKNSKDEELITCNIDLFKLVK